PRATPFPYTTLFRSSPGGQSGLWHTGNTQRQWHRRWQREERGDALFEAQGAGVHVAVGNGRRLVDLGLLQNPTAGRAQGHDQIRDRKSTRLNSSHVK